MEEKLKKYIKSVIREQISSLVESTNMKALYHFTSLYSFRFIAREDKLDAANGLRGYWGNNSHISLTRHRSNLEGFAKEEKRKNVRIQFNVDKLNASHGIFKIEPMEFYSPNRQGKFNHPNKSAKSYYQTNFFRGKEYHNQAEEGLQIKFKYQQQSIENLHKYIDRVDILFDDYYKAIKDFQGWINILSDYEEISQTVFALFVPIYVYFDNKHFVLQDGKCAKLSDMINDLNTNYGNIRNIHSQRMKEFIDRITSENTKKVSGLINEMGYDYRETVNAAISNRDDNFIDRCLFNGRFNDIDKKIEKQKYYLKSVFGKTDEEVAEYGKHMEERKIERYRTYLKAIETMRDIVSGKYDGVISDGRYNFEKEFTGLQRDMVHGAVLHRLRNIRKLKFELEKESTRLNGNRYKVYNVDNNELAGYLNFDVWTKEELMYNIGPYIEHNEKNDEMLANGTNPLVYITCLYVNKAYRNNGIAKMLMNGLIEDYGDKTITLNANSGAMKPKDFKQMNAMTGFDNSSNRGLLQPRLIKFYRSFGFNGGNNNKMNSFMVRNPAK